MTTHFHTLTLRKENPFITAARIIARGGPITHEDVNAVLVNQGISITKEELEQLKAIPYSIFSLPLEGEALEAFNLKFPRRTAMGQGV